MSNHHRHDHHKKPKRKHRVRGHNWHHGELDWKDFYFDLLEEAIAFVEDHHGLRYEELRIYNECDVIIYHYHRKPLCSPNTYA